MINRRCGLTFIDPVILLPPRLGQSRCPDLISQSANSLLSSIVVSIDKKLFLFNCWWHQYYYSMYLQLHTSTNANLSNHEILIIDSITEQITVLSKMEYKWYIHLWYVFWGKNDAVPYCHTFIYPIALETSLDFSTSIL